MAILPIVEQAARNAGGIVALAKILHVKHPTFHSWKRVPLERAHKIAELAEVDLHKVRPDFFPAPVNAPGIPSDDSTARRGAGSVQRPTHESAPTLEPDDAAVQPAASSARVGADAGAEISSQDPHSSSSEDESADRPHRQVS